MLKRRRLRILWAPVPALAVGLLAAGCGGGGVAGSTWQDRNPLPTDTMTVQVAEIGRYGGRFVIGQTTGPKTFNAIMANETSTSDLTAGRLFVGLADYNNGTQQDVPAIARSWEATPDGRTRSEE